MQITIEIPDSVAAYAAQQGMSPETYAERAVVEWMPASENIAEKPHISLDEFFAEMARFSDRVPVLSESALTREGMYDDHD